MPMKKYECHKTVLALPMTRGVYNAYRGWSLPADENGTDEGFLVEYLDGGKANHQNHMGYISWSPKDVFNRGYNENYTHQVPQTMQDYDDKAVEQELQEKGLTAPRVTPEHIEQIAVAGSYYVFPGTTVTVCCLTLRNGFTVIGESACADPANFNQDIGRKLAYANAKNKIWRLEGYLLRQRIHEK
jgi:hypothetical protein